MWFHRIHVCIDPESSYSVLDFFLRWFCTSSCSCVMRLFLRDFLTKQATKNPLVASSPGRQRMTAIGSPEDDICIREINIAMPFYCESRTLSHLIAVTSPLPCWKYLLARSQDESGHRGFFRFQSGWDDMFILDGMYTACWVNYFLSTGDWM